MRLAWPRSRSKHAFCLVCVKATSKRTLVHGRADLLCCHILQSANVSGGDGALEVARVVIDTGRKHHKGSHDADTSTTAVVVGPTDAHISHPFSPRVTSAFEKNLLCAASWPTPSPRPKGWARRRRGGRRWSRWGKAWWR